MTASAAVAALSANGIQRLELWQLRPSPFNPRKTLDPNALRELTESIRQHGVQVPLLVRPLPDALRLIGDADDELFQIVAGHRRYAALEEIDEEGAAPCIIREMTDDESREIALIDNLQREDMPALEEADAYEALRQQLGDAERIAARVGKPVEYVAKRLKLVTLGELQRQALALRLITVDHALLLARLGPEEQDANLKWCLDVNAGVKTTLAAVIADVAKRRDDGAEGGWRGYWEPQSVLDLKYHIERHAGRALSKAPWDLDDADLVPAAGACSSCPSNTAHNTSLFSDLAIEKATCEDGACFEAKRAQFVQIRLAHAADQGVAAVQLSYKHSEAKPPMEKDGSGPKIARALRRGQWVDAKAKSCANVRKGVTVDWEENGLGPDGKGKPGITKLVCIVEGCTVHPKAYEKKAAQATGSGRLDEAAAKANREKNTAAAIAENKLRMAFVSAALEGITQVPGPALRRIAYQALPSWGGELQIFEALLPGLKNIVATAPINSAEFAKVVALASLYEGEVAVDIRGWRDNSKDNRAELIKAVRALGYTGPDPWSEAKAAEPKKSAAKKASKTAAKKAAKKAPAKKAAKKKAVRG